MSSHEKTLSDELTSTAEGMKVWQQERVIFEVTERLCELMEDAGVSRSELSSRLGKSRAFVTKVLRGDANLTLKTVSDLYLALGRQFEPYDRPINTINDAGTVYKFTVYSPDVEDVVDDFQLTVKVS
jgi:transcriptional regulator with XRE-family HTH domain